MCFLALKIVDKKQKAGNYLATPNSGIFWGTKSLGLLPHLFASNQTSQSAFAPTRNRGPRPWIQASASSFVARPKARPSRSRKKQKQDAGGSPNWPLKMEPKSSKGVPGASTLAWRV